MGEGSGKTMTVKKYNINDICPHSAVTECVEARLCRLLAKGKCASLIRTERTEDEINEEFEAYQRQIREYQQRHKTGGE